MSERWRRACGTQRDEICLDSGSNGRDDHGAATPAKLRILRQGPAAELDGSANLLLRVHILRGLRREQARQCLPELRRWLCPATNPAGQGMAPWTIGCEAAPVGPACTCHTVSTISPRIRRGSGTFRQRIAELPCRPSGAMRSIEPGMTRKVQTARSTAYLDRTAFPVPSSNRRSRPAASGSSPRAR